MESASSAAGRYDLAIVGAGFSGVMVAIHAARESAGRLRIALVERSGTFGPGVAYAAAVPEAAVLNVPAAAMSAFADRSDDFVRWLRNDAPSGGDVDPAAFVPRNRYGAYLRSLLDDAIGSGAPIDRIAAEVVDCVPSPDGMRLVANGGTTVARARRVVLAVGAAPPADVMSGLGAAREHPAYVGNPWRCLLEGGFAAGNILIVGSGLTALDAIVALAERPASRAAVLSRRGRFPLPHARAGQEPITPFALDAAPRTMRAIVAQVRAAARAATVRGDDWQRVIDGLRPAVPGLWLTLAPAERARYLRHVRAIYDPHRHRAPHALLAIKDGLVAQGRLETIAGRIVSIVPRGDALDVTFTRRGTPVRETRTFAQVINCAGPGSAACDDRDPLLVSLRTRRLAAPDSTGLGFSALADGRLLDASGVPQTSLFAIGWPMRGVLLETTAVRELRTHALRVAMTALEGLTENATLASA